MLTVNNGLDLDSLMLTFSESLIVSPAILIRSGVFVVGSFVCFCQLIIRQCCVALFGRCFDRTVVPGVIIGCAAIKRL